MKRLVRPTIMISLTAVTLWACVDVQSQAADSDDKQLLLQDDFNREESDPQNEEIGNGWGTNSKTRAQGQKQVDLVDGAMHITRAKVADHGVSVHHEVSFRDATISLRFRIGKQGRHWHQHRRHERKVCTCRTHLHGQNPSGEPGNC